MDLESTPFEKDWDRYIKCAKHYSDQGFLVLLSCHEELRKRIIENVPKNDRLTIFPNKTDKAEYIKRYTDRGNSSEFILLQMDNWDKWTSTELEDENVYWLDKGEFLGDFLNNSPQVG